MAYRVPTRDDDEQLLMMLEFRELRIPTPEIARNFGIRPEKVRVMTDRVYQDEVRFA